MCTLCITHLSFHAEFHPNITGTDGLGFEFVKIPITAIDSVPKSNKESTTKSKNTKVINEGISFKK